MKLTYRVYVNNHGDVATTDMAALLAAALCDLGYATVFPASGLPEEGTEHVNLVVGPHEFFPLQDGVKEADLLRAAEASVVVGVEQAGTGAFELGLPYVSVARASVHISRPAVDELRRRGLDATHLQLGYHSAWDKWGGDPARARPTDMLVLGSHSPRRDRILSHEPVLWDCNAAIRLFETSQKRHPGEDGSDASTGNRELLASSRVLLNIHREGRPDLEWGPVIAAMANGCLVLTETSTDYGPLLPGKHLVAVPSEVLNAYAVSVMADEVLRSEIVTAAYDFLRSELRLVSLLEPICAGLEGLALATRGRRPRVPSHPPRSTVSRSPSGPERAASRLDAAWTRTRVQVKELLDGETSLIQHIDGLKASLRYGNPDHADIHVTHAWDGRTPLISVILTSYNYRNYIPRTIASVVASVGVDLELIVVDDRSDDDSVGVVRALMHAYDWFPIKLMARAANVGQSLARNMALTDARGEFVFILDSDNMIYPTTLRKLAVALTRAPDAAFSYGIIVRSDHNGLLSQLPWSVERLCVGNYIDAMTMLRRTVLQGVGGFRSFWGWEDYELWCRLASKGYRAEFLPEIVGWYRFHASNAIHTTNLDLARLQRELRNRYPTLPWMATIGA